MNLPSLDNPPLIETVLGVQFDPIQNFSNAHLGLFWKELEEEWTEVEDQQPIEPNFEKFKGQSSFHPQQFQIKLSDDPSSRLQIRNEERTRMIQIQNGRFHYNWIKNSESADYPRYRNIKPEFEDKLELFRKLLRDNDLTDYSPNQWEVTYVNHFAKGNLWENPNDLPVIFSFLTDYQDISEQVLEGINFSFRYEIEPCLGRVHVEIQSGNKEQDGETKEIIMMKLISRGPIETEEEDNLSLEEGLDKGRETIVRTFFELTSEEAQEYWDNR